MTPSVLVNWLSTIDEPHIIMGYGSLMNAHSRHNHSNIPHRGIGVTVVGFERGWVTRSEPEQQTYVGAYQRRDGWCNAQLVPSHLDPAIQQREQDYRFTRVSLTQLRFPYDNAVNTLLSEWLAARQLWICETLHQQRATDAFPVYQSYVDTCLAGCLEVGSEDAAKQFIASTRYWDHPRINDRTSPKYPRAADVSIEQQHCIDGLLNALLN